MIGHGDEFSPHSTSSGTPPGLSAASFHMSDEKVKTSASKSWVSGSKPALFAPDELDIYCNKVTVEAFVFHAKPIDYASIDHMEYDHKAHTVDVVFKNNKVMDLGVGIEWVVRPYFSKAREVCMAQTKDGKSLAGTVVPLKHKNAL